ncbi:MAG: TetR family transcriptional regulator [Mycobacteriales bacterium]
MSDAVPVLSLASARPASRAQRLRRQRVLDATIELASEGGFDAVQMRSVADRAGVALGTLYRYFPSKVHLLVSAMGQEMERARDRLTSRPVDATEPAERVIDVLRQVSRGLQRRRNLADALVRAVMFADASVAAEVDEVTAILVSIISWGLYQEQHPPTEWDATVARIIGKVWLSDILAWLSGRTGPEDMWQDLETATRLLFAG